MTYKTPRELAEEMREAFRRHPLPSPREQFDRLVQLGFINARGEVTKLLGGDAEPEPWAENKLDPNQP